MKSLQTQVNTDRPGERTKTPGFLPGSHTLQPATLRRTTFQENIHEFTSNWNASDTNRETAQNRERTMMELPPKMSEVSPPEVKNEESRMLQKSPCNQKESPNAQINQTRSVRISGIFGDVREEDILQYFKKFGKIIGYHEPAVIRANKSGFKFVFIKFKDYCSADGALKESSHVIKDRFLSTKPGKDF